AEGDRQHVRGEAELGDCASAQPVIAGSERVTANASREMRRDKAAFVGVSEAADANEPGAAAQMPRSVARPARATGASHPEAASHAHHGQRCGRGLAVLVDERRTAALGEAGAMTL